MNSRRGGLKVVCRVGNSEKGVRDKRRRANRGRMKVLLLLALGRRKTRLLKESGVLLVLTIKPFKE
jgi:hypothetical protein